MVDVKRSHPVGILLLILFFLGSASWNCLRIVEALASWQVIQSYRAQPEAWYLPASGGVWLLIGIALAWTLWLGKPWARGVCLGSTMLYWGWYWIDRLAIQKIHSSSLLSWIMTAVCLALIIILCNTRPSIRYFKQLKR
jgi:hypothetical protein